jgi:hypothetical protein
MKYLALLNISKDLISPIVFILPVILKRMGLILTAIEFKPI